MTDARDAADLYAACGQPFVTEGFSRDELAELMRARRLLEVLDDRVRVASRLSNDAFYVAFPRPIPRDFLESAPLWTGRGQALQALRVWLGSRPLYERHPELLAAVVASPDDDAPRNVMADALIAEGDPRGRFIALQCSGADPDAAAELERAYGRAWRAELGLERFECAFTRGFIERLHVDHFVPALDDVFQYSPIRTIVLSAGSSTNQRLFELLMPAVREVRLWRCRASSTVGLLAVHAVALQLEVLGLDSVRDPGECLPHLFAAQWPRLTRIEVSDWRGDRRTLDLLRATFAQREGARVQVIVEP